MDAIELLTNDHNKVRELFKKFRGGGGLTGLLRRTVGTVEPRERRTALAQICQELETHTRIEEEIFYPAVRALHDDQLDDMVREALSEHAKVKDEVRQLRATQGDEDDVDSQVDRLEQDVEHHAGEEERKMFPKLEDMMSEEQRVSLGQQLQASKRAPREKAAAGSRSSARAKTSAAPKALGTTKVGATKARRTTKVSSAPRGRRRQAAGRGRAPAAKRVTGRKRAKGKTSSSKTTKARRQKKARAGRR